MPEQPGGGDLTVGDDTQPRAASGARRRSIRLRGHYLWLLAVSSFALAMLPGIAISSEPLPVEAVNEPAVGPYPETHHWSNVPQTVIAGAKVTFSNPSSSIYHGVEWLSATKPVCEKGEAGEGYVPVGVGPAASAIKWSGKCTFSQAGTYTFYCTVHGAAMSGTITVTKEGEPVTSTEAATDVTEHEATLHGTVNPNGHPTRYHFKYGATASYGEETSVSSPVEGTADVSASALVTGRAPSTTYHFRLVATNEKGTTEGADETFTTSGPPTATTGEAKPVTETGATLKGTVNPDGKPTKSFFEWGTSESYGHLTAEVTAGEDHFVHAASAAITGLTPGQLYHFRVVAMNSSSETVFGADHTFTTPTSPPTATTATTPPPPPPPSQASTTTPEPPPLVPPFVEGSLKLAALHHGGSLHGSLQVSLSGAGGRLEVDLLAKTAALARRGHGAKQVMVGRLVRTSLSAGRVSFSVGLNARAKSALRRHRKLGLTVRITLTPLMGKAVQITHSVVLRA